MLMQANYSSVKPLPSKKENFMKTAPCITPGVQGIQKVISASTKQNPVYAAIH